MSKPDFGEASAAIAAYFRDCLQAAGDWTLDDEALVAEWFDVNGKIIYDKFHSVPKVEKQKHLAQADALFQQMCRRGGIEPFPLYGSEVSG